MLISASRQLLFLYSKPLRIIPSAYVHSITSKALRHPDYEANKYPPFDYKTIPYTAWYSIFDKTSHRFDKNTKLIIVDGPFGVGKREVCKELAKAFDFHYEEDPPIDLGFKDDQFKFDKRDFHTLLPYRMRTPDLEGFYKNPFDDRVHLMQHMWYELRLLTYIRSLRHMFNTGQGVIMNRSVMSFHCLVEGMVNCGFLTKNYLQYINKLRFYQFAWLKRPHVMIYLDAPYDVCMQRIRDRNVPHEYNSKFFSKKLHDSIDRAYKTKYLQAAGRHAELLVYDWTEKQSSDDIVMDIESLSFAFDTVLCKQTDWMMDYEIEFTESRVLYSTQVEIILNYKEDVPPMLVPELWYTGEEIVAYETAKQSTPYFDYKPGYNVGMGDNYEFMFRPDFEFCDPLERGRGTDYYKPPTSVPPISSDR